MSAGEVTRRALAALDAVRDVEPGRWRAICPRCAREGLDVATDARGLPRLVCPRCTEGAVVRALLARGVRR
jgi:ribosomal protein S27AE